MTSQRAVLYLASLLLLTALALMGFAWRFTGQ
jgi:hypothetical protein